VHSDFQSGKLTHSHAIVFVHECVQLHLWFLSKFLVQRSWSKKRKNNDNNSRHNSFNPELSKMSCLQKQCKIMKQAKKTNIFSFWEHKTNQCVKPAVGTIHNKLQTEENQPVNDIQVNHRKKLFPFWINSWVFQIS